MSGFGAPAFTATPTFEIISKVLPLPATSPSAASASTTSVLVMTRSTAPCLRSAVIAGAPLKLIFTLFPVALSNIGTSVPMTSGSGPAPATTVISAAFAAAPATSAPRQPAIAAAANLDHAFMTISCLRVCKEHPTTLHSAAPFNAAAEGLQRNYFYMSLARQERLQRANLVELFQSADPPNDFLCSLGPEHRRHQGPRLFVHPLGGERILLRARGMAREATDGAAVAQRHLHEPAARRGGVHQGAIGDQLHALLHGEHLRIHHQFVRVAVLEGNRAGHQRECDDVLAVDVRHRAVVD